MENFRTDHKKIYRTFNMNHLSFSFGEDKVLENRISISVIKFFINAYLSILEALTLTRIIGV